MGPEYPAVDGRAGPWAIEYTPPSVFLSLDKTQIIGYNSYPKLGEGRRAWRRDA